VPVVGDSVQEKPKPAAENRPKRLFSKNTGACQGIVQADVYALTPARCRKVKASGQRGLAHAKLRTEAPVNGGRNYNGPKVAKFLVG
jgi:hypothetical protein